MIDLRSDTVTRPTAAMRQAMAAAPVGDDVFGEDPTVQQLEERTAELLGKEAALFVSSGTMSNQLGVRVHCQPGDEFLCDADCHIYYYEQAAYAQLWGVAAHPLSSDGGLPAIETLDLAVRPDNLHYARTRLLTLENTHNRWGGARLPQDDVRAACDWAHGRGLATHLDGARLWNAAVATGQPWAEAIRDLSAPFDTVSVCFSKSLGAPIGSALAGPADLIAAARRTRKALGGGWRQAGILAAAALYALDHHVERLAEDNARATRLADAVRHTPGLSLLADRCDTNLVVIEIDPAIGTAAELTERLVHHAVLMTRPAPQRLRAVTHHDVGDEDIERAIEALRAVI
ncbi:L-allo-threonine aldolase [Botrimarina colliarenosi]|uniref:L-allo-threonine aldolase n=1 Tax=Botrimarina colliarenosi TaxID=2528001 RepID=A0A5C6AIG6_9BACT|nr:GntG family PLP-dependent aldolase [Botrimarina colliarenosi]TWT99200.1 L-allo-threonine aldolase [Botrimarina colliarenosi]